MAKQQGKGLIPWNEELAKAADLARGMEDSTATGQFFSIQSGQLSWNGSPLPNNQMACVVVDAVLENVYYADKFDSTNPMPPKCFAFGRSEKEMVPHQIVIEGGNHEADQCLGCPMNEWGSAGKGKSCRNTRRLALLSCGEFDARGTFKLNDDPVYYKDQQVGFLKIPVTSVKGFAAYVKQLAGALRKPPFVMATKVSVVPDAKSQFKVVFTPLLELPEPIARACYEKNKELVQGNLAMFPYPSYEAPAAPPARQPRGRQAPAGPAPAARSGRGGSKY